MTEYQLWECSRCNKAFAKENQSHHCVKIPIEDIFEGKAPELWELFQVMKAALQEEMDFRVTTSAKALTLYAPNGKAFCVFQPKKKWMDLYFWLDEEVAEFPIFKTVNVGRNKVAHFVRIQDADDIAGIVFRWIKTSYNRILRA